MLGQLTARNFFEWQAYFSIDPFGQARDDVHHARLLQLTHNVAVKQSDMKAVSEFLIKFEEAVEEKKPQTEAEKLAIFEALVAAHNAQFETSAV